LNLTFLIRRGPGQSYLKHVLADSINQIIEDRDTDLEINPVKVYARMIKEMEDAGIPCDLPRSVPPNIAAENEQVQKIIAPRIQKLSDLANQLLDTILASIDHVPYGIRWICKQIRSLTKRKYPNATEYSICSLIGGFFFLRFVNPAIVTPNAYMLVDSVPQKNPRRTLTLLAKILQNLANKPSYAKEPYMMSLSSFTEENKKRTNEFLNNLCEVGDFYESLEMDQYMALSKKDLSLSITLNELYNTHALLEQHLDVLAPSESDHLRIILSELGPAPPQVSRAENRTIELPLFSRWETPINDFNNMLTGDNSLSQSDILFMETKSIFVQLLRCMPHMARRNFVLPAVAEAAATSKDAMLVRKGIKVADMLRELEELGVVSRMDNYKLLTEEVKQELVHLGNLREKVAREIASLESVYKTICDHNQYLRSQLDSYKAYLQNVRLQASSVDIKKNKPSKPIGPIKFTHQQLEKDGVIVESNVPENRRSNIFFNIASPSPGTFVISLHYKGREKAILEMDLKLDDLLEKQQDNVQLLDLEYVQLNVARLLALLNRTFMKK
jgi:Ras GTPase-activating-like protein IQGAP2/3